MMESENGALGVIKATTSLFPGFVGSLFIHGDKGSCQLQAENIAQWQFAEPEPGDEDMTKAQAEFDPRRGSDPRAHKDIGHEMNIRNFMEAVREKKQPLVSGEEARKAVEIILAIYHSSKTGKWVDFPVNP